MKNTLKLEKPIIVNGETVTELPYDSESITPALFCAADTKRREATGSKVALAPVVEFDSGLHLYLGFAAFIAVDGKLDFSDLERITGRDIVTIMNIGRNFILRSEGSVQNNSGEQSEITAENSAQA